MHCYSSLEYFIEILYTKTVGFFQFTYTLEFHKHFFHKSVPHSVLFVPLRPGNNSRLKEKRRGGGGGGGGGGGVTVRSLPFSSLRKIRAFKSPSSSSAPPKNEGQSQLPFSLFSLPLAAVSVTYGEREKAV